MTKKKVALITGASAGIGKAIAKELLENDFIVYACARRVEKMNDLTQLGAISLKMDITKEDEIKTVISQIKEENQGVDVLINNAGFGSYGAMEDTSIEDAKYQFEVNLFGLANLTKAVLPYLREQRGGKIVNISSIGGKIYSPLGSWYHATKHALEGWSDCLRLELTPFGIDVIIIEPGLIETEFGDVAIAPMMTRSGTSAYSDIANKMKITTLEFYKKGNASPPSLVAKTVLKALQAKKPKTRYVVGKMAKPLLFLRKFLGDRFFDQIIQSFI